MKELMSFNLTSSNSSDNGWFDERAMLKLKRNLFSDGRGIKIQWDCLIRLKSIIEWFGFVEVRFSTWNWNWIDWRIPIQSDRTWEIWVENDVRDVQFCGITWQLTLFNFSLKSFKMMSLFDQFHVELLIGWLENVDRDNRVTSSDLNVCCLVTKKETNVNVEDV